MGRCREVDSGARNVDHILSGTMLPEMAKEFLACLAEGKPITRAQVDVDAAGNFVYVVCVVGAAGGTITGCRGLDLWVA